MMLWGKRKRAVSYFLNRVAVASLWTKYPVLRSTLELYENIDILQYGKKIAFLKNEYKNYKPQKAKVFKI